MTGAVLLVVWFLAWALRRGLGESEVTSVRAIRAILELVMLVTTLWTIIRIVTAVMSLPGVQ